MTRITTFAARVGTSHIRALSNAVRSAFANQLNDPEIQIIRCRYCGFKSRATLAWVRTHRKFICDGCGEEFSFDNTKVRKALDAFGNAFNDLRRRLADMRSRLAPRRQPCPVRKARTVSGSRMRATVWPAGRVSK